MAENKTTLQVLSWDLQQSSNGPAHRTNDYMTKELVVRRCEPFSVKFKFNRPVQPEDNLQWWTQTGRNQSSAKIILPVPCSSDGKSWSVTSKTESDNYLVLTINSLADAAIGRYLMGVRVKSGESNVFQTCAGFIMLFNPWCAADAVYMKDEAERKEYVLNESGIIYCGSASNLISPSQRPWDYGQCEEGILDICLKMLDRSVECRRSAARDVSCRGDPVYVSRILSAMVNAQGDNGVIVGDWSGDYEGGEKPTKWNGSTDILRRWNEGGPVRYGQCWVFGGVLCTALRCLGIPARVVTNFSSAHDTDCNVSIDRYFDENGKALPTTADSIWNFHVWVEGCFARKDLGNDYDRWQVLDATPQEESEGSFRMGPCSVNAIKRGEINKPYDGCFVFGEVSGDQVDWMVGRDGQKTKIRTLTNAVGKFISTKAVGTNKRADITSNYKPLEGTKEEREVFKKAEAIAASMRAGYASGPSTVAFSASDTEPMPKPDVEGALTHSTNPQFGQTVSFTLTLRSTSSAKMCLQLKFSAVAILYTNAHANDILNETQTITLGPKEEKKISFSIPYEMYECAITTDNMIKAFAMCEDEKGGKLQMDCVMKLGTQSIVIKTMEQAYVNRPLHLEIIFVNPLSEDVENCVLTGVGSGLVKEPFRIEIPCLKKNQRSVTKLYITPYRPGQRCLVVGLTSEKMCDVKGSLPIEVSSA